MPTNFNSHAADFVVPDPHSAPILSYLRTSYLPTKYSLGTVFVAMTPRFPHRAPTSPPPDPQQTHRGRQSNRCGHSSGAQDGGGGARSVRCPPPRTRGGFGRRPAGLGHVCPDEEEGVRRDRSQLVRVRLPGGRDTRGTRRERERRRTTTTALFVLVAGVGGSLPCVSNRGMSYLGGGCASSPQLGPPRLYLASDSIRRWTM